MITTKQSHWRFSLFASQIVLAGFVGVHLMPAVAATETFKPIEKVEIIEQAPPWAARPDALEAAGASVAKLPPEKVGGDDTPERVAVDPDPETAGASPVAARVNAAPNQPEPVQLAKADPTPPEPPATAVAAHTGSSNMETWYRNRRQKSVNPVPADNGVQAAAERGDRDSQYELGMMYQGGRGVPQDMAKAKQWFTQAAQKGHGRAQYALALLYRQQGDDISQSIKWQRQAAQSGYAEAQYGLGLLFANGQYLPQDKQQALFWFQRAAAQNHHAARVALQSNGGAVGVASHASIPVSTVVPTPTALPVAEPEQVAPPAVAEAAKPEPKPIAPKVAEGDGVSDFTGVEPEVVKQSAEEGNPNAQLMLGTMYEDGVGGLPSDLRDAAHWYEKAANQGYAKAQYNLGLLYEDGRGVKQDYTKAAHWYEKAAKSGFSEAQNNLGVLHVLGKGVKKDPKRAKQLFSDAAAQGNTDAARNLSMLKG